MASRPVGRRTPRRGRGTAAVALAGASLLAACSGGGDDAPGESTGAHATGIDGDTITLGAITVDSGPMAAAGHSVTAGNQAYFAALDEAGGVAGEYRVEIEVIDGADDPATVLDGYERSRPEVAMYVQVLGFRSAGATLTPLSADDTLAGTLAVDFPWSRHQNLVALGTPLTVGVFDALDWYVHAPGARSRLCGLVDEGDYGAAARDAIAASASVLYLDDGPVIELPATAPRGSGGPARPTVAAAVDSLAAERCDVVVAATLPPATTAALARAADRRFAPVWFVPTLGRPSLRDPEVAAYAAEQVWLVADDTWSGPGPEASDGLEDMEAARAAHAPGIAEDDPWFLLGYLQAAASHQVLEQAVELGDLTPAGILTAANASLDLDFAGLTDDYHFGAPEYREPPGTTVLTRPDRAAGDDLVVVDEELTSNGQVAFETAVRELRER